jgi:enamine deaminase RidA (YjgF/YER057c/UK114 family)
MATQKLNLTRDQLASFLQDHEQIKQFENLFAVVDTIAPDVINEVNIAAGTAQATANEALAQLTRIANALELLATAPAIQNNNSIATDYIDFPVLAEGVMRPRRVQWNDADGCLDIGMGYDAVVLQTGLESLYRIKASSDISNGDLVMFTGAVGASGVITGAPSATGLAEGLYIMGVATMDIPNNDFGYVTAFGLVRGINTTGASVGESWSDGDILYYNPSYVGGMTNVRPTSPAEVVVVAAVVNAGPGGSGSLFIRPSFYPRLTELSNVYSPSPVNGNLIIYNQSTARWENALLTAGANITITNGAGSITVDASAGVSGSGSNFYSGTYTPTLTNTTNVAASSAGVGQYMRVGNVVTVSGQVNIDPTATGDTIMGVSIPVASNFSAQTNAGGTFAVLSGTVVQGGSIYADSTNDRVTFRMTASDVANRAYQYHFTYRII